MKLTLADVATAVDGRLVGVDPSAIVRDVVVDSRAVVAGSLFVALPGEHADGHDFGSVAITAGAVGVLAGRDLDVPHVRVADPLEALGLLAASYRRNLAARVVGITGSVGKTATKDLVAALLGSMAPTVASPGSFNNDVGLPLTVLSANEETRFLVLEMGSRGLGHIARLCAIAAPQVGVVLNVGSAHLGEFGSREAIAQAKGELVEAASELAILHAADPYVLAMGDRARGEVRTFAVSGDLDMHVDVRADDVSVDADGRASFRISADGRETRVSLRLVGAHQVANAVAAATVALACGLDLDDVAAVLSAVESMSRWRMEVRDRADGLTVVNDAYNANPESMRAALDALVSLGKSGRRTWAVLGPMLELGEVSRHAHEEVGRYAARVGINQVVAVDAPLIAEGAGAQALQAANVEEAVVLLDELLRPGDIVLVKASRGSRLERLAEALLHNGRMRPPLRDSR